MRPRVFLDTNIFVFSFEFPESNSNKVIGLLNKGQIEAITSEQVLKEVQAYFKRFYDKDLASSFRDYILRTCTVMFSSDVKREVLQYKGLIKDLEQLATAKKLGIKFLLSYDRDFENFDEYITPKKFIKEMGIKSASTDY